MRVCMSTWFYHPLDTVAHGVGDASLLIMMADLSVRGVADRYNTF
jgi:hypothetical protein